MGLLIDTATDYARIAFFPSEVAALAGDCYLLIVATARRNKYVTADAEVSAERPPGRVECANAASRLLARGRAREMIRDPGKTCKKRIGVR